MRMQAGLGVATERPDTSDRAVPMDRYRSANWRGWLMSLRAQLDNARSVLQDYSNRKFPPCQ